MKTIAELKPKTVYQLFKDSPERWIKGCLFSRQPAKDKQAAIYDSGLSASKDIVAACIIGGIVIIYGSDRKILELPAKKINYIKACEKLTKIVGKNLIRWNNNPELTYEEFLATIKKARI